MCVCIVLQFIMREMIDQEMTLQKSFIMNICKKSDIDPETTYVFVSVREYMIMFG